MTVAKAANESGLSESDWLEIEGGTLPDMAEGCHVASALGVTVDWLVCGDAA